MSDGERDRLASEARRAKARPSNDEHGSRADDAGNRDHVRVEPAPVGENVVRRTSFRAPPLVSPIGHLIKGRYVVKSLLGEGGMGGVYEAEHVEIGKRVAIKIVHALHARDPHIAARLKQEARSTSAIESEHIVHVFDAGEDAQLGLFLVMELLRGEDLGAILARRKRLGPVTACALVVQAAQGLGRAHAAGIVHRDIKPANIFVSTRDDGTSTVKLVDFGIAKLVRDARTHAHTGDGLPLTRSGSAIGTPQYMSPEQAQGLPTVDHCTDIYSLGAVLFELVAGEPPFAEMPTYEQTILNIMTRPAPRLRDVVREIDPDLDRLVSEMLSSDPANRPADMATVRERLVTIYPELDTGRMPFRSVTNEVSFDSERIPLPRPSAIDGVKKNAAVKSDSAGVLPATHVAVTVDGARVRTDDEPVDVPGLPRRRNAVILVSIVVALAVVLSIVAFVRSRSAAMARSDRGASFPPSSVANAAPPPSSVGSTAPPVPIPDRLPEPAPQPSVLVMPSAPAALSALAPMATARPPSPSKSPARAPASARPKAKGRPPANDEVESRPVGGTGVTTEF